MARPQLAAPSTIRPASRIGADAPLADFIGWDDEVPALGLRNRLGVERLAIRTPLLG